MTDMGDILSELIAVPAPPAQKKYYDELAAKGHGRGLAVKETPSMGKGLYATRAFAADETVLHEPMLAGMQHSLNRADALVCSECLRYVGSVARQLAHRLAPAASVDAEEDDDADEEAEGGAKPEREQEQEREREGEGGQKQGDGAMLREGGRGEVPLQGAPEGLEHPRAGAKSTPEGRTAAGGAVQEGAKAEEGAEEAEEGEDEEEVEEEEEEGEEQEKERSGGQAEADEEDREEGEGWGASSGEVEAIVAGLLDGSVQLPDGDLFPLPPVVDCRGGCGTDVFCSEECETRAWRTWHCLLCPGPRSHCANLRALEKFLHHADETNDIFRLAAKVLAMTLLRAAEHLAEISSADQTSDERAAEAAGTAGAAGATGAASAAAEEKKRGEMQREALLRAWAPFSMGHKAVWWEAMALPEDVDPSEESAFREDVRSMAHESLVLLKAAIYDSRFAPLFLMEVYARVVGMFELNNLAVVVQPVVENYFLHIDDLPPPAKAEAERVTRPLLRALGDDYAYATPCEGTAFYALQSCCNHSCRPSAKAFKRDEDVDGSAVLLATRDIQAGEEITLSYIDESDSLEERQAALLDYGFKCRCEKCMEESNTEII